MNGYQNISLYKYRYGKKATTYKGENAMKNAEAKNFTIRLPISVAERITAMCREKSYKENRTYRVADFMRDSLASNGLDMKELDKRE